jgi:signal transduction histidine kinase
MPRTNSLTFRLIAGAGVVSVLALLIGGFLLSGVFRSTAQATFDAQLSFDMEGLIAAAEPESEDTVVLEGRFLDPRYARVLSGWYWQIVPERSPDSEPQKSRSLIDYTLVPAAFPNPNSNVAWDYAIGPDDQPLRVHTRRIAFGPTQGFRITVAGNLAETQASIARFNRILVWALAGLGIALLTAIFIQVRVGLVPLRRVSEALARIREGRARKLEGEFPSEIEPLANELNSLIAHSAEVVGRARTHVANLAHFLKTPLTVIANEASATGGPLADAVIRQVTLMRRQVDHYLARARAAGALDVLGSRTEVAPVAADLARVLPRMHPGKPLDIGVIAPEGLAFRGEREDLEEMIGNLIDNACKWARGRVLVEARPLDQGRILITVGDDGRGLLPEERARAMERGERLDESVPGNGLGLAIVRDVAKLYGGSVSLGESKLGGLEAILELPRAR